MEADGHFLLVTSHLLFSTKYFEDDFSMINRASLRENRSSGFPTRSDTNQAVQPRKIARGLQKSDLGSKGLYYPCSENKGADQLRGYREADLRLCFRICKKPVFS